MIDNSILILQESCWVQFINNYATNNGGVVYISNPQSIVNWYACLKDNFCGASLLTVSPCILKSQTYKSWTRNFIFANISAEKGGDIVYGWNLTY